MLLEEPGTMKRFEYSLLGKELKKQTSVAEKQYQKIDHAFEFDEPIKKEKPTLQKYIRSNLVYYSKYRFYLYYNIKNFDSQYPNIQFCSCSIVNEINLII